MLGNVHLVAARVAVPAFLLGLVATLGDVIARMPPEIRGPLVTLVIAVIGYLTVAFEVGASRFRKSLEAPRSSSSPATPPAPIAPAPHDSRSGAAPDGPGDGSSTGQ